MSLVVVAAAKDFAVVVGDSGLWNVDDDTRIKTFSGTRSKIVAGPRETIFGLIGYAANAQDWAREFRQVTDVFRFPRMSSEMGERVLKIVAEKTARRVFDWLGKGFINEYVLVGRRADGAVWVRSLMHIYDPISKFYQQIPTIHFPDQLTLYGYGCNKAVQEILACSSERAREENARWTTLEGMPAALRGWLCARRCCELSQEWGQCCAPPFETLAIGNTK